jgi:preprotein translocase subunit SecG
MLVVLMVLLVLVAGAIMLAILLQTGSAGLGAAITGTSQQMYGKKKGTDEILERVTMVLGALLIILTLLASRIWH